MYVYPAKSCDLLSAIAETNQLVYPLNKHLLNISWVPSQVRGTGAPLSAHLPGESQRALPAQFMGWQVRKWPRLLEEVMFENGLNAGWELAGGGRGGDRERHPA